MKQYKLIKDLPTIEAGRIFEETESNLGGTLLYLTGFDGGFTLDKEKIKNLDEWFEEIDSFEVPDKFKKGFYTIRYNSYAKFYPEYTTPNMYIDEDNYEGYLENCMETGLAFETKQEVVELIRWLKARATLLKDTKGFKPDWNNENEWKYYVEYDFNNNEFLCSSRRVTKHNDIFFASKDNLKYSLEVHEEEWKIYLGVE